MSKEKSTPEAAPQASPSAENTTETPQVATENTVEAPPVGQSRWLTLFEGFMVVLMRLVVGGVFMFSGFVKAIDPWGTYYKLGEYMQVWGLDSPHGLLVVAAFALASIEFTLGAMLVTGSCRRGAPLIATLFMLVMTPLTLWLAITDAVPDCGCFGDFLVLSNWATFGKNVALLAGCLYLLILNKRVRSIYGPAVQWMVMALSFAVALSIAFTGYSVQPLLDFRPYKVGRTLTSNATSTDGADYVFIYSKDGVEREFVLDSVPDDDSGWEYVDRREVQHPVDTTAGPQLTIAAWDHGDDMSDSLLRNDRLLLIVIPDMADVSVAHTFRINELQAYADQHGVAVAAITSGTEQEIAEWVDIAMAHYPIYNADDSEIKMIARGNPAVVYIDEGRIVWKKTLVSINPEIIHNGELSIAQMADDFKPREMLDAHLWTYLMGLIAILFVNRFYLVFRRKKKTATVGNERNENNERN